MKPLDINTTDFLKAILPFGIVITHYIPLYGYDTLLLGESIVAMFFFMSGYGLSMSKKKITKYLVIQRVSRLLVPFALSIILFQLASLVCGNAWLRTISYPIYLVHGIVIFLYCHFHLEGIMSLFWGLLLVGGATIPIAYLVSLLEKEVQFKCFA